MRASAGTFVLGIALAAVALAMIWFGRARNGEALPFLENHMVGMVYVLACMALLIAGVGVMIAVIVE